MGVLDRLGGLGSAIKSSLGDLSLTNNDSDTMVIDPETGRPTRLRSVPATVIAPGPEPGTPGLTPTTAPDVTTSADAPPSISDSSMPLFRRPGVTMTTPSARAAELAEAKPANYLQLTANSPVTGEPSPAALGGLSKLGKLLFIGQHLAEGGLVGSTQRGLGEGFTAEQQYENQQQGTRQALTRGGLENQTAMANLQFMPWKLQQEMRMQQAQLDEMHAKAQQEQYLAPRSGGVFDVQSGELVPGTKPTPKQTMNNLLADATQDAVDRGVDPNNDPTVQQLTTATKALQPEKAPVTKNMAEGVMQYDFKNRTWHRVGGLPPVGSSVVLKPTDVSNIVDAIQDHRIPPVLTGLGRGNAGLVNAEVAKRRGMNLATLQNEWRAEQQLVSTMNGTQFSKQRTNINSLQGMLPQLQALYNKWKQYPLVSGYKAFNRAALRAAENLPGQAGADAQALEGKIADVVADLGSVYMGGNTPTDHGMDLARQAFSSDWNDETFSTAMKQAYENVGVRRNAIEDLQPAGPPNPYAPQNATPTPGSTPPPPKTVPKGAVAF